MKQNQIPPYNPYFFTPEERKKLSAIERERKEKPKERSKFRKLIDRVEGTLDYAFHHDLLGSLPLVLALGAYSFLPTAYASQYKVRKGDNLTTIARELKTTPEELARINKIQDINKIKTGQVLKIPEKTAPAQTPIPTAAPAPVSTIISSNNPAGIQAMISAYEGRRNWVYDDATGKRLYPLSISRGNRTIGVGFNLERSGAKKALNETGANYTLAYRGISPINDSQIDLLLQKDINTAVNDARKYLPNFDSQPEPVRTVVVDMAFNMGIGKLSKFKTLRQRLLEQDYRGAANAMKSSKWYNQTGRRAREHIKRIESIASQH